MTPSDETLSPKQFRFLDAIKDKERSGAVIHEIIEESFGEIARHRFRDLASTLVKRNLVAKTSREKSQTRFYRITDLGKQAHLRYVSPVPQTAPPASTEVSATQQSS